MLISLLVDFVQWHVSSGTLYYQPEGKETILKKDDLEIANYTEENKILIPNGKEYVTMWFSSEGHDVGSVIIRYQNPLESDTIVRIYYTEPGMRFASDNLFFWKFSKGQKEAVIDLPKGHWQSFRLDFVGNLNLSEIVLSEKKATQLRFPYRLNVFGVAVTFFVLECGYFLFSNRRTRAGLDLIDKRIIDPNTRYKPITVIFGLFALVMVLHHVYSTVWCKNIKMETDLFSDSFIIFAAAGILLGKMWKNKGFWFLLLLFALKVLRTLIPAYGDLYGVRDKIIMSLYLFFGCYSVGRAVGSDLRKLLIKSFCALWTIAVVILCCFGLYVAWTDNQIITQGGHLIGISENRLCLANHFLTSGLFTSVSIAIALVGNSTCRHKTGKILYICAIPVIMLAGILTATRVNYIMTAVSFSLIIALKLYDKLKPEKKKNGYGLPIKKWGIVLVCFMILTILFSFVQPFVIDGFIAAKHMKGFSSAMAEEERDATISSEGRDRTEVQKKQKADASTTDRSDDNSLAKRDFVSDGNGDLSFNGRTQTWKATVIYLINHPQMLIWGQSMNISMDEINEIRKEIGGKGHVVHCHNTLVQTLLESGIPGFLLYACFIVYFMFHAYRLMTNTDLCFWNRIIPVPTIICLIGEMADFTIGKRCPQVSVMFLFAGLTIAYSQMIQKNRTNKA